MPTPAAPSNPAPIRPGPTHLVGNQARPLENHDLYGSDVALVEAVAREGAGWDAAAITALGVQLAEPQWQQAGHDANAHPPALRLFDRFGHRVNQVEFHPSYHQLFTASKAHRIHDQPWIDARPGALVARLAKSFLMGQVEQGHGCPVTMTFAAVPALRHQPEVAARFLPRILTPVYDGEDKPWYEKQGLTIGMAMTEKQGGSDVRANTTRAVRDGDCWRLVGHKWFCSAPMCDAFLTLAYTDRGLTCFLVPRWDDAGARNPIWVQRLKEKVGNRSNASSEIEYHNAQAWQVGEEGRGVRTILEMVAHTRLDCIVGSAATIRQVVVQAAWHAGHRAAFGATLLDKPLMQNVLADLQLESEAATAVGFRIGRAWDEARAFEDGRAAEGAADSRAFARIATAVAKYHVCKIAPTVAYEAMECLGGGGFVEESPIGRHFRDAPVNSIWEGSGNVICLDVLRAMAREPESVQAFAGELVAAKGLDGRYDAHVDALLATLGSKRVDLHALERNARSLVERMARALQAAVLLSAARDGTGSAVVAEAFCASRLGGQGGRHFGTLGDDVDLQALVQRALPQGVPLTGPSPKAEKVALAADASAAEVVP
ncbi:MAG: acyl-CoA dehydrogenase family protein [Deltaproteobacteria bacterium]|nr:acyl-CoA dehydrogenase family protein [Deltaproteobacteria bacterium]